MKHPGIVGRPQTLWCFSKESDFEKHVTLIEFSVLTIHGYLKLQIFCSILFKILLKKYPNFILNCM